LERYICIHGHFYQPPRENPWLETIAPQHSAHPYHDWNERIVAECYTPNTASRILDGDGRIVHIVNNYARISFNFGPTLLAWLEKHVPATYHAIIEADRQSRSLFSGHGSAIAQAYNHMILPLASKRDKRTQVIWGIRDFERRFGRMPEGMWLPETAVDTETLETLAECGIHFTILSPYQARTVRKIGTTAWQDVGGGKIDSTMPYVKRLPSGRSIAIFFYDGPISRAVAFEGLLYNGGNFAHRLLSGFNGRPGAQLVHIATDGETYGHHHPRGDMALAYAISYLERERLARLTNYSEFLAIHPPTHEVQIAEQTSWSCFHGIDRWRSDCGCSNGGREGWKQTWRAPLRAALDWLRDTLAARFETAAERLLLDPWAARDDYIHVVLDRSPESINTFLAEHATRELSAEEQVDVLHLLEIQRQAMLMYTSCGWFFAEISGLETVQVLQYAARAIQLARTLDGDDLEPEFLRRLAEAPSNLPQFVNGRGVYEQLVLPHVVDLRQVAAHHAATSLFNVQNEPGRVYCYTVEQRRHRVMEAGHAKLALGVARVTSTITLESAELRYGVLHLGDQNLIGGVRTEDGAASYADLLHTISPSFERADLAGVVQALTNHFGRLDYSLKSVFYDEQRAIVQAILTPALQETAAAYQRLYDRHTPLISFLTNQGIPLPPEVATAAEYAMSMAVYRALTTEPPDFDRARSLIDAARRAGVSLAREPLVGELRHAVEQATARLMTDPESSALLDRLLSLARLVRALPFGIDLWRAQNDIFTIRATHYAALAARALTGDQRARIWTDRFATAATLLGISMSGYGR
jgi:alpha-amylase/alpha-mannosidase (GH57 family)